MTRTYGLVGTFVAAVGATLSLVSGVPARGPEPEPRDLGQLELGRLVRQTVAATGHDRYHVPLSAGEYAHVVVEQKGIDVAAAWLTPDGKPIVEVDSPNGAMGPEPISLIAESAGAYLLDVRPLNPADPPGQYEIELRERRAADPRDQARVEAQSLQAQGQALERADRRRAVELYRRALERWREAGALDGEIRALCLLASADMNGGDYVRALDGWNDVIRNTAVLADPGIEAGARIRRSELHGRRGDVDAAASDLQAAEAILARIGEPGGQASTSALRGRLAESVSDLQTMLDAYHRALELFRRTANRREQASALNGIAVAYASAGSWARARSLYEEALVVARSAKERRIEAIILSNVGWLELRAGDTSAALDSLEKALALLRALGDRPGEAITLGLLGGAYRKTGDRRLAGDAFEESLKIRQDLGDPGGRAVALNGLASLAADAGDADRALTLYEEARAIRHRLGQRAAEADTLYGMSRVLLGHGTRNEAWVRLAACLDIVESLSAGLGSPMLRSTFLGSVRDYYEAAVDVLMQQGGAEREARALETSERNRARSLVESIIEESNVVGDQHVPQVVEKERALRRALDAKAERRVRLLSGPHSDEEEALLARDSEHIIEQYDQTLAEMRAASPNYAITLRPPVLSAVEIQRLLPDDGRSALIEYALGTERSYAWIVSRHAISSVTLSGRSEIEAAVRRVRDTWSRPATPGAGVLRKSQPDAVRQLSDLVIAPLADKLTGRRLMIVPDGALHYVPFSALLLGATPLIDSVEVVSVPAASALLRRDRPRRPPASKTLAVLADPVFEADDPRVGARAPGGEAARTARRDTGERHWSLRETSVGDGLPLARLTFSRMEARAILSQVPRSQRLVALDFRASRATALSPALADVRIVHFATHSVVDSTHPELSGIILSLVDAHGREQSGVLSGIDVLNLRLRADVVVLSGCETALGREIRGEGPMSLGRGFLNAGAATVVASLWNVDDSATAALMKSFYAALLGSRRLSPSAALRAAQLEMRTHPRWRDPRFWAGFVVYGDGD